jgi:peptide/nickel transport system permease protein
MSLQPTLTQRLRGSLPVRGSVGSWGGRCGLAIVAGILLLAFVGPHLSYYSPFDTLTLPLEHPSQAHPLGTDGLGRDVLARFLYGGRVLVAVAFLATILAYVVGIPLGMAIGYRGGAFDLAVLGAADLILAFPAIVFVLVLLAAAGAHLAVVVLGIATINLPRVVRISRTVTVDLATREFVEAAVARGEGVFSIIARDILPNIWTPVLADFGIRLTGSVILFSSLSYLGFGQPPPAADWGLMISENRVALFVQPQPWVVVVPAVTIALLCIGVNLIADAVARSAGRSVLARDA